jgi:hypothetical protein
MQHTLTPPFNIMQKLLFFVALTCALPITGQAQPILNTSSFNTIGDQIHLQPCHVNGVTEGSAGANQTWDLSNLQPRTGDDYTLFYVDPAQTPNGNLFPAANLATEYSFFGGPISYAYFNQNGADYQYLGASFEADMESLSEPNLLARVPMTFGQTVNSTAAGQMALESFQAAIYGKKTQLYDGYGTLKLPNASYTNAIRLKTLETRTDSVTSFSGGLYTLNRDESTSYAWYVPGIKSALLEIRYSTIATVTYVPGIPLQTSVLPTETTVTYQLNATSGTGDRVQDVIGLRLLSANPCENGQLSVEMKLLDHAATAVLVLVNAQGQVVNTQHGSDGMYHFHMKALPSGIYQLSLITDKGNSTSLAIVKL